MVIWLNYEFPLVLWRALARTVYRVVTRKELFSGNRESLRKAFLSRESILWWVVTSFHAHRKQYQKLFASDRFPHLVYVELQKPSEAEQFLAALKGTT
ncbi:MAG TPA: hypothetical protein VMT22_17370 [Terriglobales bacterium]|jgi:hypothetical protein|nr:hypothetical protein [Terriglobales bacterium]